MTDLPHLAARLYGTPLMIARPKLAAILEALGPRLAGGLLPMSASAINRAAPQIIEPGIAVVPVLGTLVRRSSYLARSFHFLKLQVVEPIQQSALSLVGY